MQYCTVRVLYYISTIASSTSTVLVYLADTYSEQLRADPTPSSKTLASFNTRHRQVGVRLELKLR